MAKYRVVTTLSDGKQINSDPFDIDDATIEVGTTETLAAGEKAYVKNVGTARNAVLNFGIPHGADSSISLYEHLILLSGSPTTGSGAVSVCLTIISTQNTEMSIDDVIPHLGETVNNIIYLRAVNGMYMSGTSTIISIYSTYVDNNQLCCMYSNALGGVICELSNMKVYDYVIPIT